MKSSLLPGEYLEDTIKVNAVKRYHPADKSIGRKSALVSFTDRDTGGLRTVKARDIINIK